MKGNAKVVAQLNVALKEELTAVNQYFLHAEMCHKWGYHALGGYIKKQSIDEMKHAEKLIERILFLDALPKMDYLELNIGVDVKSQLAADHKLELAAVEMYNKAIRVARDNNDDTSRELFAVLLKDEEEHVEWLEAQLHQIKELGYETYLSNLTEGEKD
jgi:bacterioferritin